MTLLSEGRGNIIRSFFAQPITQLFLTASLTTRDYYLAVVLAAGRGLFPPLR